jgi:hypothetical protein
MKTKMIIGIAILLAASLSGCDKKQSASSDPSDPYGYWAQTAPGARKNYATPTGNGVSPYTGLCNRTLDQNQENAQFDGISLAKEAAHAVALHGENGLVNVVGGDLFIQSLAGYRTPLNDLVLECARRVYLNAYETALREEMQKKAKK